MRLQSPYEALRHLRRDVYVRLKQSKLHGIGVFAIRTIPKGVDPFQEKELGLERMPVRVQDVMNDPHIPHHVKILVNDMCVAHDGFFHVPACGMNGIMLLYYMNESKDPNMKAVFEAGRRTFRTRRQIQEGEELTINYSTYSDDVGAELPSFAER